MEKVLKKNSFFKSTFIVASLTLVSRFAGLVRDVLISNVLGVTMVADAFFIALRLPKLFTILTENIGVKLYLSKYPCNFRENVKTLKPIPVSKTIKA